MKRFLPLLVLLLGAPLLLRAGDQLRDVQTQLKGQGFFYGDVDGKSSQELAAAIRRYQIRNGLEVTGELNPETLGSLGIGATAPGTKPHPAASTPLPEPRRTTPTKPNPPVNLRRDNPDETQPPQYEPPAPSRYQRNGSRDTAVVPPPAPLDDRNPMASPPVSGNGSASGGNGFSQLFAGTPYSTAPRVIQEGTLRRAQQILAGRGFYRDEVTGQPGPGMEEAILAYQRSIRLPLTGRLDIQTLSVLHLLPGRGAGNPPLKPFNVPQGPEDSANARPTFRGVWVQ